MKTEVRINVLLVPRGSTEGKPSRAAHRGGRALAPAGARSAEPQRCGTALLPGAGLGQLAGPHLWNGSSDKNGEVTLVFLSRFPERKHGSLRFVRKRGESERRPPERGARIEPAFFGLTLHAPRSALSSRIPGRHAGSLLTGSSLSVPKTGQLRTPAFPTPSRTVPPGAVPVLRRKLQQTPRGSHSLPSFPPDRRRPPPLREAPTHLL